MAAGVHGAVVTRAAHYLQHAQNPDGGLPQQPGDSSNAQSTAWAIQGLDAAGTDVARVRRDGSVSPLGYLEGLMAGSGSVRYSRTSTQTPVWVTGEALAALAGKPLPVAPPPTSMTSSARRTTAASTGGTAHRAGPTLASRAHPSIAATSDAEAARASATARALGALAALMLSPVRAAR